MSKKSLAETTIPHHVGFIMDGNRRWAKSRGLPAMKGHEAGVDALERAVDACFERGVKVVSAYAFSTENWERTKEEVSFLLGLVTKILTKHLDTFHEKGIKIVVLGTREKLTKKIVQAIETAEETTHNNKNGTLALCFNYGGTKELVGMVKELISKGFGPDDITDETLFQNLYHPEVPPCDVVIRTSGEMRTSGFMLARSAYSEFIFDEKRHWPDIEARHIDNYLKEYASRCRRYGK